MSWILQFAGFALYGLVGFSLVTAGITLGDWQFWAVVLGSSIGSSLYFISDDLK